MNDDCCRSLMEVSGRCKSVVVMHAASDEILSWWMNNGQSPNAISKSNASSMSLPFLCADGSPIARGGRQIVSRGVSPLNKVVGMQQKSTVWRSTAATS